MFNIKSQSPQFEEIKLKDIAFHDFQDNTKLQGKVSLFWRYPFNLDQNIDFIALNKSLVNDIQQNIYVVYVNNSKEVLNEDVKLKVICPQIEF